MLEHICMQTCPWCILSWDYWTEITQRVNIFNWHMSSLVKIWLVAKHMNIFHSISQHGNVYTSTMWPNYFLSTISSVFIIWSVPSVPFTIDITQISWKSINKVILSPHHMFWILPSAATGTNGCCRWSLHPAICLSVSSDLTTLTL